MAPRLWLCRFGWPLRLDTHRVILPARATGPICPASPDVRVLVEVSNKIVERLHAHRRRRRSEFRKDGFGVLFLSHFVTFASRRLPATGSEQSAFVPDKSLSRYWWISNMKLPALSLKPLMAAAFDPSPPASRCAPPSTLCPARASFALPSRKLPRVSPR